MVCEVNVACKPMERKMGVLRMPVNPTDVVEDIRREENAYHRGIIAELKAKIAQQDIDAKKARALMEVIDRMIQRYRKVHGTGDLDENLFRLFNEAKGIHCARGETSLKEAVKRVQMIKV